MVLLDYVVVFTVAITWIFFVSEKKISKHTAKCIFYLFAGSLTISGKLSVSQITLIIQFDSGSAVVWDQSEENCLVTSSRVIIE